MILSVSHRRLIRIGLALLCSFAVMGLGIFLTANHWLPMALRHSDWVLPGFKIMVKRINIFPLGELMVEGLVVESPHAANPGIVADYAEGTYSSLAALANGDFQNVTARGVTINVEQLIELGAPASPQSSPSIPLYDTLTQWVPRASDLENVRVIIPDGKIYLLRKFQLARKALPNEQLRLSLGVESAELNTMLPVQTNQPLRLALVADFAPRGFQIVSIESNLTELAASATNPADDDEQAASIGMKNLSVDLDEWARVIDLPVAGKMRFDLEIPEWHFEAQEPSEAAVQGAYLSDLRLIQRNLEWSNFLRGWSFLDSTHTLALKADVAPNLSRSHLEAESKLRIGMLDVPGGGTLKDVSVDLKVAGGEEAGNRWAYGRIGFLGPNSSEETPTQPRLRLDGSFKTLAVGGTSVVETRFDIAPLLEGPKATFAIPMKGVVRQKMGGMGGEGTDLKTSGTFAGGTFDLWAGSFPVRINEERTSLTLALHDASLSAIGTGLELIGRRTRPAQGKLSTTLAWDRSTSSSSQTSGTLRVAGLQLPDALGNDLLAKPLEFNAAWDVLRSGEEWKLRKSSLEIERNLEIGLRGNIIKSPEMLHVAVTPTIEVDDFAKLLQMTRTVLPISLEGSGITTGTLEWQQNAKAARIDYKGLVKLSHFGIADPFGLWGLRDVVANMPITLKVYQDMVQGTAQRPVATVDFDIPRTSVELDTVRVLSRQARWLSPVVELQGHLFINPDKEPDAAESMQLELNRFAIDLPGMTSLEGKVHGKWGCDNGGLYRPTVDSDFAWKIPDLMQLNQTMGFEGLDISGSGAWEEGHVQLADNRTTISGRVVIDTPEGQMKSIFLGWKEMKAKSLFAVSTTIDALHTSQTVMNAVANLTSDEITAGGVRLQGITFDSQTSSTMTNISLSGTLAQGKCSVEGKIDGAAWPPSAMGTAVIRRMDLAVFTDDFHPGDMKMAGKVNIEMTGGWKGLGVPDFTAKVTSASPQIMLDKVTVRRLLVDWAKQGTGGFLIGGVERTLKKQYRDEEMIPFDSFKITSHMKGGRLLNVVEMKNRYFNITFEPNIEWPVIVEFMQFKQEEMMN